MYQVGDKVRLVSERPNFWAEDGAMDHYLGAIVTIKKLVGTYGDDRKFYFRIDDNSMWTFQFSDVVELIDGPSKKKPYNDTPEGKRLVDLVLKEFETEDIVTAMMAYARKMCELQRYECAKTQKGAATTIIIKAPLPSELKDNV